MVKMTEGMDAKEQKYELQLMEQQLLYRTLKDLVDSPNRTFDQVNKTHRRSVSQRCGSVSIDGQGAGSRPHDPSVTSQESGNR